MKPHFSNSVDRILAAPSEEELCEAGTDLLSALFDSPATISSLTDADQLVSRATTSSAVDDSTRLLPLSFRILQQTAQLKRPVRIDDCTNTRSAGTVEISSATSRSVLLVPIRDWGLIIVEDKAPSAFDDRDLAIAALVAEFVGSALEDLGNGSDPTIAEARLKTIASTLSHDIASPLNVAQGYLDEAIDTGNTDDLDKVRTAIERIEEITEGMTVYARTGQTVEQFEPAQLDYVAQHAWSMVGVERASLEILESETVLADESRLKQLFENLFSNAISHGGSSVTIRVGVLDTGSGFFVEDDGPGITPDIRDVIFDHGYSEKETHPGYGLSIVQGIVKGHGWQIKVTESEIGGARFEISGVTHYRPSDN